MARHAAQAVDRHITTAIGIHVAVAIGICGVARFSRYQTSHSARKVGRRLMEVVAGHVAEADWPSCRNSSQL